MMIFFDNHNDMSGDNILQTGVTDVPPPHLLAARIGRGSFGIVYRARTIQNHKVVAVKLESSYECPSQLRNERDVYKVLEGGAGFPRVRWYGMAIIENTTFNALIMDLLGPDLEDRLQYCGRKFSLKTVLMLAEQMIVRIEHVHTRSYVYRDLNPKNFVIGRGDKCNKIFLIDFGRAKKYRNEDTHEHIKFHTGKTLISTPCFATINAHLGAELSRRDDMESLGYLLLYFMGTLPWQGFTAKTFQKYICKVDNKKITTSIETLCKGHPEEFATYMNYCRKLKFEEAPDYQYLRGLFRQVMTKLNLHYDYVFDWMIKQ